LRCPTNPAEIRDRLKANTFCNNSGPASSPSLQAGGGHRRGGGCRCRGEGIDAHAIQDAGQPAPRACAAASEHGTYLCSSRLAAASWWLCPWALQEGEPGSANSMGTSPALQAA
jgi:hypothetical protein